MAKQIVVNTKQRRRRKQPVKQARGSVGPTAIGKAMRLLGTAGGTSLGAYFGNPALGGAAGNGLAAALSRWMGQGDYSITSNSVVASASGSIPAMHNAMQSVTVRHKEYLGVIKSSVDFRVQASLPLNPGMMITFPWLAPMAAQFSEYAIKGLVFHYVPTSGNAITGTNPALGSVMMQTSYRATEAAPLDKLEMLNEYWSSEGAPNTSFVHPVECKPRENPFEVHYVRTGTPSDNLLWYDLGTTFVATQGMLADDNVLGDLWVTYEVELKKPIVRSEFSGGIWTTATGIEPNASTLFTTFSGQGPLGVTASGGGTLVWPKNSPGSYLVVYYFKNTLPVTTAAAPAMTYVNMVENSRAMPGISTSGMTAGEYVLFYWVKVVDPLQSASMKFNVSPIVTGGGTNIPWVLHITKFR